MQENDVLRSKFSELSQTNFGAESAYGEYFPSKVRCEGFKPHFEFIGEIDSVFNDSCLHSPMAIDILD